MGVRNQCVDNCDELASLIGLKDRAIIADTDDYAAPGSIPGEVIRDQFELIHRPPPAPLVHAATARLYPDRR